MDYKEIQMYKGKGFLSGTMIKPQVILTALKVMIEVFMSHDPMPLEGQ